MGSHSTPQLSIGSALLNTAFINLLVARMDLSDFIKILFSTDFFPFEEKKYVSFLVLVYVICVVIRS